MAKQNDLQIINLFEIPTGKQTFIAKIKKIRLEEEYTYHGNLTHVPYVYFKDIKILIGTIWYSIKCSGQPVKYRIGKRLEKIKLEEEDIISFDAQVVNEEIAFLNIEGKGSIEEDNYSFGILPLSYRGNIVVEFYETAFNQFFRLWKENYSQVFDRKTFDEEFDTFNYKQRATPKKDGLYRSVERMYFYGKGIKNLSNIEKMLNYVGKNTKRKR